MSHDNPAKDEGTIVLILGAGCSMKYDYPSAKDMVSHVKEFASTLGHDCSRMRQLVLQPLTPSIIAAALAKRRFTRHARGIWVWRGITITFGPQTIRSLG